MATPALLAFAVTASSAPLMLVILRRHQVIDVPGDRSSHDRPTPRGGGLAPALGLLVAAAAYPTADRGGLGEAWPVVVAAIGFGFVGLLEDLAGVPALRRLMLQAVVAAAICPFLLFDLSGSAVWQVGFSMAVVVWLVAYVNAYNFMDGINGIAAVQVVVAGAAWWAIAAAENLDGVATGAGMAAAAGVAFLPFNFPSARMFLGDVGSYFLGAWVAALAVVGLRAGLPPEAVAGPLALTLADTGWTLVARVRGGDTWYQPHRRHTYQRLVQLGWSHARTTLAFGALAGLCAALGAVSMSDALGVRVMADLGLAGIVVAYLMAPRLLTRWRSSPAEPGLDTAAAPAGA